MDLRIRLLIKRHLSGTELNLSGKRLENKGLMALARSEQLAGVDQQQCNSEPW